MVGIREKTLVEVEGLTKRFKEKVAVENLTFSIREGEVFGLLGPNGAGKTTTIRMLLGLVQPSSGRVRIAGQTPGRGDGAVYQAIGWVPQTPSLDPLLTGREVLLLMAGLYGVGDALQVVEENLRRSGLEEAGGRLLLHYSGGMKKRLELAVGTLHRPRLLILDEPTAGLDVGTRHGLWELVRSLKSEGTTVLLTTHYLDEADALCDRVAILEGGRLLALASPAELKRRYGKPLLRLFWSHPGMRAQARAALEVHPLGATMALAPIHAAGEWLQLPVDDPLEASRRLALLVQEGVLPPPEEVEVRPPSLDQVFARVTGKAFDPVTGVPLSVSRAEAQAPSLGERQADQGLSQKDPGPTPIPGEKRVETPSDPDSPSSLRKRGRFEGVRFLRHTALFLRRWGWRLRRDLLNQAIAIGQPVLWFLLFGSLWQAAASPEWAEGGYLRYMIAGAAMMTVFNVALMGGLDVLMDRERGALERFLASPAHPMALVASRFLFVTAFGAVQALLVLAMAALFGVQFAAGVWAVFGVLFLAFLLGSAVSSASLALAFWVPYHGHFYTITGLVGLPAVFLSSTFAPLDRMPGWMAALARLNPLTYAVDGGRSLVVGSGAGGPFPVPYLEAVLALLAFNAVTVYLAYKAAKRHVA